jgi:hypothetical protein
MEQIRASAMDAFFSLPHGGAEIGGVLWGTRSDGRVRILAARPLECEYALGPTFTLSGKDHARLAALLDDGCEDLGAQGWEPAGWYRSDTRSGILLSDRDVDIHNRYFPDPWHVALVVRPHAITAMRAGFFFREADGSIHADSSFSEFFLEPLAAPIVEQPAAAAPVAEAASPPAPRSRRRFLWFAIVLGIAAGLLAFRYGRTHVFAAHLSTLVSLMAYDLNGQLQIRWDGSAEPIMSAEAGTLEITDGAAHTVVALNKRQLRSGTVGYVGIGARVDVRMALHEPEGKAGEAFTTFLGQAGDRSSPEGASAPLALAPQPVLKARA